MLCNYAPFSDTRCIVLHENSIRVIRVAYEYTVNWQQIPLFIFSRSAITRGFIMAYCFSSLLFSFFPNDRVRQIPKQLFLGQYPLNRKRTGRLKEEIKGEVIEEEFAALASQWCVHTTESEGDCRRHGVYERSKRFFDLLCIPQTLSIIHFPAQPAEHIGLTLYMHTHVHKYNSLQQCLAFNYTVH